jgi:hypothetical protein
LNWKISTLANNKYKYFLLIIIIFGTLTLYSTNLFILNNTNIEKQQETFDNHKYEQSVDIYNQLLSEEEELG